MTKLNGQCEACGRYGLRWAAILSLALMVLFRGVVVPLLSIMLGVLAVGMIAVFSGRGGTPMSDTPFRLWVWGTPVVFAALAGAFYLMGRDDELEAHRHD